MIEFYINEIIRNHFKNNKDHTTIILKITDQSIIGEAVISENQITFYRYDYCRDNDNSPWKLTKIRSEYKKFKQQFENAHRIEVV